MNVPFVSGNLLKKTMVQVRIQKLKKQGTKRIKDNPMIEELYFHPKAQSLLPNILHRSILQLEWKAYCRGQKLVFAEGQVLEILGGQNQRRILLHPLQLSLKLASRGLQLFEMFSIRGKYLLCFLIFAASIHSSAEHVNLIRSSFFSFADHMQMPGRSFVLQISGKSTINLCQVGQRLISNHFHY